MQLLHQNRSSAESTPPLGRPRLGFVGVGWIGRNRMEALAETGRFEIAGIADPNPEMLAEAHALAPGAACVGSLKALLDVGLDGLVIATPNALHAEQAIQALERGVAVFCQKPLGRSAEETREIIDAARRANRLLGVDLSYRHTRAMQAIRSLVREGGLGEVFAADLVFHNAYGPGKSWPYDPKLSGGGCLIDLGIHLVDLALWTLDFPGVRSVEGSLRAKGRPLRDGDGAVEDYAVARVELETGALLNVACSWDLPAGQDAVIEATFYGTGAGASMRNVDGSYFDFVAHRYDGRVRTPLAEPPDAWGGRAAVAWAERLTRDPSFDPEIEHVADVAEVLDTVYGRSHCWSRATPAAHHAEVS